MGKEDGRAVEAVTEVVLREEGTCNDMIGRDLCHFRRSASCIACYVRVLEDTAKPRTA